MRSLTLALAVVSFSAAVSGCAYKAANVEPVAVAIPDPASPVAPSPYLETASAINAAMRAYHYNPRELDNGAYRQIEAGLMELAKSSDTDEAFIAGFKTLWADGPFSHVVLNKTKYTADETATYLDTLRVGNGASLTWQGDAAILTVNTMMGLDTIEQIDAAYAEIAARGATRLIIDLRNNGGGAFAMVPLVEHVLAEPLDAGAFVAQRWNGNHERPPVLADIEMVEPWTGWSIRDFWSNATSEAVTRIRLTPRPDPYTGPVMVLISGQTASAAELAADALKASGRATLIGETTSGEMLSQKMFDLPGEFQLSLPIADYFSMANGRIEGRGVTPDVPTDPVDALDVALSL
jgi:carboxyl-terminal processing protease